MPGRPLPRAFYERRPEVVARDLLGCTLVSRAGGSVTAGRIVETEAYLGPEDAASHAAFRPGSRHLFSGPGGIAYVYRIYGLHDCLNAIAGPRETPGCVLIRALQPVAGVAVMARRRGLARPGPAQVARLASGPGNLTRALGITRRENGGDLRRGLLTIRSRPGPPPTVVGIGPRVGITRAAELPLRFWVVGDPAVTPAGTRGSPRVTPRRPAGSPTGTGRPGSSGPSARRPRRSGSPGPPG